MRRITARSRKGLAAIALLTAAGAALAQTARDDGGAARLQAMIQQLTAERARLEAESAELRQALDSTKAELEQARVENASLQRRLAQSETSLGQAAAASQRNQQAAEQLRGRMDELVAQFRQTIEQLRATELERNELRASLETRDRELGQCAVRNVELYEIGLEVLERYEGKGCFASLRQKEPFTQNRRVRLENLIDEYRWRMEDQLLPDAQTETARDGGR